METHGTQSDEPARPVLDYATPGTDRGASVGRTAAVGSLVFGVLGLGMCPVLGVVALTLAADALAAMRTSGDYRGYNWAMIGIFLGLLEVTFLVVVVVVAVFWGIA